MIRVKSGTIGVRSETGAVIQKTSKDLPFALSAEEEKRLVRRGVAVYVDGTEETPSEPVATPPVSSEAQGAGKTPAEAKGASGGANVRAALTQPQLARLNVPVLEAIASNLSVDLSKASNSKGRAALIWAELEKSHSVVVAAEDGSYDVVDEDGYDEDNEAPPNPGAEEPVS